MKIISKLNSYSLTLNHSFFIFSTVLFLGIASCVPSNKKQVVKDKIADYVYLIKNSEIRVREMKNKLENKAGILDLSEFSNLYAQGGGWSTAEIYWWIKNDSEYTIDRVVVKIVNKKTGQEQIEEKNYIKGYEIVKLTDVKEGFEAQIVLITSKALDL